MKRKYEETQDTSQSKLDLLPVELKLAILTRLPAKSLVNLRSVSKSWSSIIQSQEFVRSFFSISSTRPRLILGLSNGIMNKNDEMLIFFFSFSPDDESSSLVPRFEMAIPYSIFSNLTGACPSVHGFLAVEADYGLSVVNPSTEQYLKLPRFTRHVGYDPIDHQYKALSVKVMDQYQNGKRTRYVDHKVLTLGGGGGGWRLIDPPITTFYTPISKGVCINGFVYYGAHSPSSPNNPGIVCFDVRSERLTYIKAPMEVVMWGHDSPFIEYKGKFASIVCNHGCQFQCFALWVLEDVHKHEWSKQICAFPLSLWDYVGGSSPTMTFTGTNKAGEIIIAPMILPRDVQPFYIFYYNVETRYIRTVRLLGIGDNQEFRCSYGFVGKDECHVRIAPEHIESIAFFNNPTI